MSWKCPHCNARIADDNRNFCTQCGLETADEKAHSLTMVECTRNEAANLYRSLYGDGTVSI